MSEFIDGNGVKRKIAYGAQDTAMTSPKQQSRDVEAMYAELYEAMQRVENYIIGRGWLEQSDIEGEDIAQPLINALSRLPASTQINAAAAHGEVAVPEEWKNTVKKALEHLNSGNYGWAKLFLEAAVEFADGKE